MEKPKCVVCLEEDDDLDANGVCPECRAEEQFKADLYEDELRHSLEYMEWEAENGEEN